MLPGSDGRSSTWDGVASALRAQGDEVLAIDGWSNNGLLAQAAAVAERVGQRGAEILVTWSYSGLVGALGAARPTVLRLVVHIDALLPGLATTNEELRKSLNQGVLSLIGDDIDAATSLPDRCCPTVYVSCVDPARKPSLAAIARSATLTADSGIDIIEFPSGHQAMKQRPTQLTILLSELTRSIADPA
jgi:hypothetical protein